MTQIKQLNCDKNLKEKKNCEKYQILKLWQNTKTPNVTKLNKSKCDKPKNSNMTKLKMWLNSKLKLHKEKWKTQNVTKLKITDKNLNVTKHKI